MWARNSVLRVSAICASVLAVGLLAGCNYQGNNNSLLPSAQRQIQPRNPDKDNHETLRVMIRDSSGSLKELDIYKLEGEVRILKDGEGKNTGGSIKTVKGPSLNVEADESGKHASKAKLTAADGSLIVSQERLDKNTVKTVVALEDDLTAELLNSDEGNKRTITVKQANGTPVMEARYAGLQRLGIKLYSPSGQLLYEENRVEAQVDAGAAVYVGVIHGPPDGRITQKVTIKQFSSQNDPGSLDRVEAIGDDGVTVTSSADTRWDDDKSVSLGVFGDQKGLRAKLQEAFDSVSKIKDLDRQLTVAAMNLLQDKTR